MPRGTILLAAAVLVAGTLEAGAAGFRRIDVPLPDGTAMQGGVWYPTDTPAQAVDFRPYTMTAAMNASPRAGRFPLVVLSHGTGGWFGGHYDLAVTLADAGYVVAAISHPGDNARDHSGFAVVAATLADPVDGGREPRPFVGQRRFLDRPHHTVALIRHMTGVWDGRDGVDAGRVAVFGFSAGGYDAIVAAGGMPDFGAVRAHCGAQPDDPFCTFGPPRAATPERVTATLPPPQATAPVKALVLAAPAPGPAFDADGLARVGARVQIWRGDEDERLGRPFHADHLARAFGERAEVHAVPGAGHFAFMPPCPAALREHVPELCSDPPGFDRTAFHRVFNAEVVRFLDAALR